MENTEKTKMVYRYLGNSGLKVSLFAFGTMLKDYTEEYEAQWLECAKHAFEKGINYFDCAESYGDGAGDRLLGKAIKEFGWKREELVISVKMFRGPTPTTHGLSRKKIVESCLKSLKNIGVDYCDVVFAHRYDFDTPLEETCRAYHWLIENGYAFYWATSAWPQDWIMEAIKLCEKNGWHKPIADQCEYNCLIREHVESSYVRLFENYGLGTTIWSPLGGGFLSGKYNEGNIPKGSRYDENKMFKLFAWDKYIGDKVRDRTLKILKTLKETADELGCTQPQLALAWAIVNKDVSSCIIGASSLKQLEGNLEALEIAANWNEELEEKLTSTFENQPETLINYSTWAPTPARRPKRINYDMKLGEVEPKE